MAPSFGNNELSLRNYDGLNICQSSTDEETFRIPLINGVNQLTNLKKEIFKATEVEVWRIILPADRDKSQDQFDFDYFNDL